MTWLQHWQPCNTAMTVTQVGVCGWEGLRHPPAHSRKGYSVCVCLVSSLCADEQSTQAIMEGIANPLGIPILFELLSLHLHGTAQDFVEILMAL